jgi:hypothetical protein
MFFQARKPVSFLVEFSMLMFVCGCYLRTFKAAWTSGVNKKTLFFSEGRLCGTGRFSSSSCSPGVWLPFPVIFLQRRPDTSCFPYYIADPGYVAGFTAALPHMPDLSC